MYRPKPSDPAGVWNAYVEAGTDKDDRNARLAEAPEHLRRAIRQHVNTAWQHQQKREKPVKRDNNRTIQKAHRRVGRNNPYGNHE